MPDINADTGAGDTGLTEVVTRRRMKPAPKKSCTATKDDGTACGAAALPGSQFCFFHDPAKAAARRKAQSAGGLANKMATLPADAPDVKVEDGADVVKLLGETINQVRRGEIDPRVGQRGWILGNIMSGRHGPARTGKPARRTGNTGEKPAAISVNPPENFYDDDHGP